MASLSKFPRSKDSKQLGPGWLHGRETSPLIQGPMLRKIPQLGFNTLLSLSWNSYNCLNFKFVFGKWNSVGQWNMLGGVSKPWCSCFSCLLSPYLGHISSFPLLPVLHTLASLASPSQACPKFCKLEQKLVILREIKLTFVCPLEGPRLRLRKRQGWVPPNASLRLSGLTAPQCSLEATQNLGFVIQK